MKLSLLLFLLLTCIARNAGAAVNHDQCKPNCYVATTGNDSTGNGTIGNPWLTLAKCFNEAYPGDTCWFRGGTYTSPENSCSGSGSCGSYDWGYGLGQKQNPEYYIFNNRIGYGGSAGNPVTIRGYPGETVVFTRPFCDGHILLAEGTIDYVTFMDIIFKHGRMFFSEGSSNITFERNVWHANTTTASVPAMLMSGANGVTSCVNWIIRNNLFISDNTDAPNACGMNPGQGEGFTDFYSLNNSLIEHNDFIVTANAGNQNMVYLLGLKAWDTNTTIQYNYIANFSPTPPERGLWLGNWTNGSPGLNTVRYNIFNGVENGLRSNIGHHDDSIYNNTFFNSSHACWTTSAGTTEFVNRNSWFNNICVASNAVDGWYLHFGGWTADVPYALVQEQSYLNYNMYWKVGGGTSRRYWENSSEYHVPITKIADTTNSITAWQTYLSGLGGNLQGDEANSRVNDPGLTNPSAGDFRLVVGAAARTGGRGGSYPTFIGAEDPNSTSDYVGCNFDPRCHGYAGGGTDTTPPAKPTGLRVQ